MDLLTWGDIKQDIQETHGIETDASYTEQELINMYNKALTRVESHVIGLQQDYFLAKETIAISKDVLEYDLPTDIYAYKIRRVFIDQPGYNVRKVYKASNLDDMEITSRYESDYYGNSKKFRYIITNESAGQAKFTMSYVDEDANLIIYYTRNPKRLTITEGDAHICDIPEFADAIKAHMSYQIEWKDKSPTTAQTKADYIEIMGDLTRSLAVSINDEDNMIEPDTELFDDHV